MKQFQNIKLLFSGDFAPLIPVHKISDDHFEGLSGIIEDIDLHITNLECPLTLSQHPVEKTGPSLKADSDAVALLKQAKVDIVCLANNHIFDYGEQGIKDTINICEKNKIEMLGIVSREDQQNHWLIKDIKDKKIGFLNYCEHEFSVREKSLLGACGYDPVTAFYDVGVLKTLVDYLIIIYHGGNEYFPLPNPEIKKTFHFLADLGADTVIGHHTHVYSGYEIYKGKPLVYSLGNFFFPYNNEPEEWYTSLLCQLEFGEEIKLNLIPVSQNKNDNILTILNEEQSAEILAKVRKLSVIISNDKLLGEEWGKFIKVRGSALARIFLHSSRTERLLIRFKVLNKLIGKLMNTRHRRLVMYNILRCQSLRDLITGNLQN